MSTIEDLCIEDRSASALLTEALNCAAKSESWLLKELKETHGKVRYIRLADWSHTHSWDCGRQDSLGDKQDQVFRRWLALKLARRIQRGEGKYLKLTLDKVLGL